MIINGVNMENIKLNHKSEKHQIRFLNYMLKKCEAKKDCETAFKFFEKVDFASLNIKVSVYVDFLKKLEDLMINQKKPTEFLVGIPVLKKCYENIGEKAPLDRMKENFCVCAYQLEGNEMGYKMWLDDAVKAGIFSEEDYKKATNPEKISDLDYLYNF